MVAEERETTVTVTDVCEYVQIYSCRRKDITALRKNPKVTITREGVADGSPFVFATVPATEWSPVSGIKRTAKPLTEEQKQERAARLRRNVAEKAKNAEASSEFFDVTTPEGTPGTPEGSRTQKHDEYRARVGEERKAA